MRTRDKRHARIKAAMSDYGYKAVKDGSSLILISMAIPGFTSDETLPYRFSSLQAAAEYLIPIIHNDDFWHRVTTQRKG